jgi:AGZA family xanthine/uracil permease-like MFS transporter
MLERLFKLKEHGTNVRTELVAGLTTFLTMAYIIFVNPMILSDAGMDFGAVFVATCLAAALGSLIMGLFANYPVALAPGMGLNAFFTYTVVGEMGYSWEVALGAVFISGVLFTILSLLRIREILVNSIPPALRAAIAAGIGLFLGLIALKNANIVIDNPATLVGIGNLKDPAVLLAIAGFIALIVMERYRIKASVIIAILGVTAVAVLMGMNEIQGVVSMPPSVEPTFAQLDLQGALSIGLVNVVFAFFFVDLFDTTGTLVGVTQKAGLLDKKGKLPRVNRALMADSTATMAGAFMGTATTTSYIESTAGVSVGGRTGLTAVTVAVLFLAALFFSPLASSIPAYATAPALFYVAVLMVSMLTMVNWDDVTDAAPVMVTAVMMPFTFSIATGIALGFIAYAAIKVLSGKFSDLSPAVVVIASLFIAKILFFGL